MPSPKIVPVCANPLCRWHAFECEEDAQVVGFIRMGEDPEKADLEVQRYNYFAAGAEPMSENSFSLCECCHNAVLMVSGSPNVKES